MARLCIFLEIELQESQITPVRLIKFLIPALFASILCLTQAVANDQLAPAQTAEDSVLTTGPEAEAPSSGIIEITPYSKERHELIYTFEHQFMPRVWFKFTEQIWEGFASNGKEELGKIFTICEEAYKAEYPDDRAQLELEFIELVSGVKGWLVCFPKPQETPDANYAALIIQDNTPRYIVGEYDDLKGPVCWYLCEWTGLDQNGDLSEHINYGIQDVGTKQGFLDAINTLLAEKTPLLADMASDGNTQNAAESETAPAKDEANKDTENN